MKKTEDKVEFFHSESSFGSESVLSQSRYYDFTNELIAETDNIFLTLKRQLVPNQNLLHQEKIKYALTRAQIINKDTIPEHLIYLHKIEAPSNATEQVILCQEKLNKLLGDYDKMKNGTMIYKQFYNLYGKEYGVQQGAFSRKTQKYVQGDGQTLIKPQYIQINYNTAKQKLRAATPRVFMTPSNINNQKEIGSLREEIYQLKKTLEQNRKRYDLQISNQKLSYEKRLRSYLKSKNSDTENNMLKQSLAQTSQNLARSLKQSQQLKIANEEQNKIIETLKVDNTSLQEQIQLLRKIDINVDYQDYNKSYTSQQNKNDDKIDKRLNNLMQQNQLMKNQLKTERMRLYRLQSNLTQQEKRQLERMRKNLQKKKSQLDELYTNFDKQRIEILQLTHTNKSQFKLNETLTKQNLQLKKRMEKLHSMQNRQPTLMSLPAINERSSDISINSNKTQILDYEGDGIQGYPYYQILSKEFKIRFKRACLKEKELLYKSNGVEVGVITTFQKPNKLNFLLHITNYSEHQFQKVKIKIMNANENRISGQVYQNSILTSNQQVKIPVTLTINQYPIGPLILLLEYYTTKKQDLRILLPAHIFKIMEVEDRIGDISNGTKISISTERKICKDLNDLKQYVKDSKIIDGVMKISLFNEHTHTILNMNIIQSKDGVDICYQHKEGSKQISEYFIKTFTFLLAK